MDIFLLAIESKEYNSRASIFAFDFNYLTWVFWAKISQDPTPVDFLDKVFYGPN